MIELINDGPKLVSTNYWDTEHANVGLLYLSGNAGTWRLLVPEAAEGVLHEMRTGKTATIEPSLHGGAPGSWDVVFEDGTDCPFSVALSPGQIDRAVTPGRGRLTVWTQAGGQVLDLACQTRA